MATTNISATMSAENVKTKFKHQIALAKQKAITWDDLSVILYVLTPTVSSMRQLIQTLLEELRSSLANQNPMQIETEFSQNQMLPYQSKNIQQVLGMDHSDGEDSFTDDETEMMEDEFVDVLNDDEMEQSYQGNDQKKTENFSQNIELDVALQNEFITVQNSDLIENEIRLKCIMCDSTFVNKNTLKCHYQFRHRLSDAKAKERVKDSEASFENQDLTISNQNDMEIPTLEFEPQAQSLMIPLTNSDENSPSNLLQAKAKERVKYCESSLGNEFPEENQDLTVNNEYQIKTPTL